MTSTDSAKLLLFWTVLVAGAVLTFWFLRSS
jgi:hypothetical protein